MAVLQGVFAKSAAQAKKSEIVCARLAKEGQVAVENGCGAARDADVGRMLSQASTAYLPAIRCTVHFFIAASALQKLRLSSLLPLLTYELLSLE